MLYSAWAQIITATIQILSVLVVLWCIRKWQRLIRELVIARDASVDALDLALAREAKARERTARMESALWLIAAPMRPDGTWNRDREACRHLAQSAVDEEFA